MATEQQTSGHQTPPRQVIGRRDDAATGVPVEEIFPTVVSTSRTVRIVYFVVGWITVAIGSLGIVLPVLPTTPFFIAAAYCFSRSSPRFEAWVLGLPAVGPMVRDYRAGFGVPRRVKIIAISMVVVVGTISSIAVSSKPRLSIMVAVLCLIGIATIVFMVPLRETVLARRGLTEDDLEAARAVIESEAAAAQQADSAG